MMYVHYTRSPHLRLLQPKIRNSERKRRLGVNLAPIKFHIFYQVRFWYPLEINVKKYSWPYTNKPMVAIKMQNVDN